MGKRFRGCRAKRLYLHKTRTSCFERDVGHDEERELRDRVSQVVRGEERERRMFFSHVKLLDTVLLAVGEERDCDERFSHIL